MFSPGTGLIPYPDLFADFSPFQVPQQGWNLNQTPKLASTDRTYPAARHSLFDP